MLNPIELIGKNFNAVQEQLELAVVEFRDIGIPQDSKSEYSVLSKDGTWEMILSPVNKIDTLFLHLDNGHKGILGINTQMSRKDIIEKLGEPQEHAEAQTIEGLGEYGAWEKYYFENYHLHIQHKQKEFGVNKITLISVT